MDEGSRLTIEGVPALVCAITAAGELEVVNQQLLEYFGKTLLELKGSSLMEAVHPQDLARVLEWRASLETGEPYEVEHRLRGADGVYRWFHVRAFPQRETQGQVARWHVLFTDVDVHKRAEEKLRRSEATLLDTQRLSRTGSWTHDLSTGRVAASPETVRMWGLSGEDDAVTMDALFARLHPEDRAKVEEAYREAQQAKASFELEFRTVHLDGTLRNIRSIGRPILDDGGNLVEFVSAAIDITEQALAEEALRKSEERWRAVFENSAIGVALTDLSGRFLATNSAYQKMLGYTEEEIGNLSFLELTHEDYREANAQLVGELLTGKRTQFQIEKRYWQKDGSLIWVSNNVSLVPGTKSMPQFLMALSENITERKRAEETLRKTQAELAHVTRVASLGEMTAAIAHEVSQPLAAVVHSTSACVRWLDSEKLEKARVSAARANGESRRASEIIDRIRALVKKAPPQKDWLDVNETILEVIALTRSEIQRSGVGLEIQLSESVPAVLADRVQLQQVILNLTMNAIEAMTGAGTGPRELLVRSGTDESKQVVISVQDSGPGFDPNGVGHLFEAFHTTKPEGLGMGLAISRSIVELHGGRLSATPNRPRGAVFQFTLPVGEGMA